MPPPSRLSNTVLLSAFPRMPSSTESRFVHPPCPVLTSFCDWGGREGPHIATPNLAQLSHQATLLDLWMKYALVAPAKDVIADMRGL